MKEQKKIIFSEKNHRYIEMPSGKDYTSVSKVFEKYKPKEDWDFIKKRCALKELYKDIYSHVSRKYGFDNPQIIDIILNNPEVDLKKFNDKVDELTAQWKDKNEKSTERGTAFHKMMEEFDIKNGYAINKFNNKKYETKTFPKEYDNETICWNLYDLPDGYYPELLIHDPETGISGQADKIFIETIGDKRFIDGDDYKTDENIFKKPNFFHPKKGLSKLEYPLNHIYNSNYNHYMIKISMYAYMLEKFGFEVRDLRFTSVVLGENLQMKCYEDYLLPYKKWEVEKIFSEKLAQ